MIRKILLPTIFLLLTYGFWVSPDFKAITAGIAIFLFGMLALEEGFKAFTGGILEKLLKRTTDKLWKSVSFGVLSTTLMQSSSLVSVITISFLSAELIPLAAGIGIVFGANLGTTTGAWLVAGFGLKVKLSAYAMPLLVFGVILIFQKAKSLKGVGYILAGIGFLFLGIHYMKDGFDTFKQTIDLAEYAIEGYPGLFVYALIGIIATVIMQSSHATLVLILTALAAQQITYDNALALAIGSNVGTTITAILGSLSSNEQGKRLAGAHLIFNMITGLVAILLIHQLIQVVDWFSNYVGISSVNYTLKLAVFHTIFNVIGIVVMLPFISRLVVFLEKAIPTPTPQVEKPRYLSKSSAEIPDAAIEAVRKETARLYEMSVEVITHGLSLNKSIIDSDDNFVQIINNSNKVYTSQNINNEYERRIKTIYAAIVEFISQAHGSMSAEQSENLFILRGVGRDIIESIKGIKHLQKNLNVYLDSSNQEISQEYNNIRIQICHVLIELNKMHMSQIEDKSLGVLSLDLLRVEVAERDNIMTSKLDNLIRRHKVNAEMAVSLMNDSAYCQNICRNLIHMGSTLFVSKDKHEREIERSISLGEIEITEIIDSHLEGKIT
jgi:phosphate:Na+ symporter